MNPVDLQHVLDRCHQVAAELVAEAVDPAVDLKMVERRALLRLSLAVEAEAARAVGIEPRSAEAEAVVMRELMVKVQPK